MKENENTLLLIKLLNRVQRKVALRLTCFLDSTKINGGKIPFFMNIAKNEGLTQEKLTSNIGVNKAATTRSVKVLENDGYIIKTSNSKDFRNNNLYLSQKGKETLPFIKESIQDTTKIMTAGFSKEELSILMNFLNRMLINVESED